MSTLQCVAVVLILIALWQYTKPAEKFGGEAPRPYTPNIVGPAWAKLGGMSMFENADTPNRAGTLLQRMGMEDSGNRANASETLRNRDSGIGRGTNWTRAMNF